MIGRTRSNCETAGLRPNVSGYGTMVFGIRESRIKAIAPPVAEMLAAHTTGLIGRTLHPASPSDRIVKSHTHNFVTNAIDVYYDPTRGCGSARVKSTAIVRSRRINAR